MGARPQLEYQSDSKSRSFGAYIIGAADSAPEDQLSCNNHPMLVEVSRPQARSDRAVIAGDLEKTRKCRELGSTVGVSREMIRGRKTVRGALLVGMFGRAMGGKGMVFRETPTEVRKSPSQVCRKRF